MRKLAHRAFPSSALDMLKAKSYESIAEEVRQQAEAYVATVGAENVESIAEDAWQNRLAVVVWHDTAAGG